MLHLSAPDHLCDTPEFREMGFRIVQCPVCGEDTLDSHWICKNCGWEYDGITGEDDYSFCNRATIAGYLGRDQ